MRFLLSALLIIMSLGVVLADGLSLGESVEIAQEKNPRFEAARQKVRVARSRYEQVEQPQN